MLTSTLLVAALLSTSAAGHTVLTNIIVNGVTQTSCVRPHPSSKYDYPISDITNPNGLQSTYMTCGWIGKTTNAASKCTVPAGSTVGIEWHYEGKKDDTFIVDPSHKGPCLVYMSRSDNGTGNVWFKIYESGYENGQFCVDKVRANKGVFEAKIPNDLAPGNYLLRAELIALHEGFELGGAQPYIHCAELTITGSGSSIPSTNLVAFPGAYKANDPGIYFDIYDDFRSYPIPGPPVYVSGAVTPTPSPTPTPTPVPTPTPTPVPTPSSPASSASTSTSKSSTSSRSSTTTGKGSTTTTGKASTSSGKSTSTSTGRASTSSSTSGSSSSSTSSGMKTGACPTDGYMNCASDNSYQTCNHGTWTDARSCQTGTRCSPSGNYIYCI